MNFFYSVAVLAALVPLVLGAAAPGVSGGIDNLDINDETAQQMARFAVSEIGDSYNLVSVEKAGKQVVAGLFYHLTLTVNKVNTDGNKSFSCKVKVLEQNWVGLLELTEFKCSSNSMV